MGNGVNNSGATQRALKATWRGTPNPTAEPGRGQERRDQEGAQGTSDELLPIMCSSLGWFRVSLLNSNSHSRDTFKERHSS